MSFALVGLRLVDDVPHTGGLAALRIPVAGPLSVEPQIGAGVGDHHLAYLARAMVSLDHLVSPQFGVVLGVGYGLYGERSTGGGTTIERRAPGPVAATGVRWMFSGGLGLYLGMSVARVRYAGDGADDGFSATVPHLMAGLAIGR
jgi:hypothetical protein